MGKRGYFFTLDAFMAVGVIVLAIVLVLYLQSYSTYTSQTGSYAQDYIDLLAGTKLSDLNVAYIDARIRDGTITNADYTVLEQAGEFYYNGNQAGATALIDSVVSGLISSKFGVKVRINDEDIYYPTALTGDELQMLVSKKLIFGLVSNQMWSYVGEVYVWER